MQDSNLRPASLNAARKLDLGEARAAEPAGFHAAKQNFTPSWANARAPNIAAKGISASFGIAPAANHFTVMSR